MPHEILSPWRVCVCVARRLWYFRRTLLGRRSHVAVPVAVRQRLRAGPDHRHGRLRQSQAGHARADRREGGREDHGQDAAGQRPAARQARDQRAQEPVAPEHLQAVPGDRHGDALLRGHGVLRRRRTVRSHRPQEPSE